MLSAGQLALLAEHGEERRGEVGDVLFRVGDRRYPLIAIIEGEAAVLDQTGAEIPGTRDLVVRFLCSAAVAPTGRRD